MLAQKLDNDLGKIIHITAAPEGLTFDPKTGELWSTDIGPEGGDEINIIKKGAN
jgi:glucose/arabinose dehydrogenase